MSVDTAVSNGMDRKGRSLPQMPEPLNPVSMKQAPEVLGSRKIRTDKSTDPAHLMTDPALLIDKATAHLAVTLQDTVLQKMGGHSHERLKDLTSRMLNGEQDKPAKLCGAEGTLLKGADTPPPHASPQRKSSSPELKLKITKLVANSKPNFEPSRFGEDGERLDLTGAPSKVRERKKRRNWPMKAGPKPRLHAAPAMSLVSATPECGVDAPDKVCKQLEPLAEVKEEGSLQVRFFVGDVVWTKVSGYPWWPCMVTTDPALNKHVKQKAVNSRTTLMYHVQYFGDMPERGYVFEKSMVSFSGEEQYQELCQGSTRQAVSRSDRRKMSSSVPLRLRAQWDTGVSQAMHATGMGLEDRMAKFSFTYANGRPHLNPHVQGKLYKGQGKGHGQGETKPSSLLLPDQNGPPKEAADPAHTPPNSSTSQTKKTALKKTPSSTKRVERVKRPLPTEDKPKISKSSKERQLMQPPPQAPFAASLGEEALKPRTTADSRPVKKTTQLVMCLTGLPGVAGSAKKPIRSKSHPTKERSDLKGKRKAGVQKRAPKRPLSVMEEDRDERPKKRVKVDSSLWKQKSDSPTAAKIKSRTKFTTDRKKKASEISRTSSSESKPLKKQRGVLSTRLPTPAPRKRRALPCPEPEMCEQRAESPSDSTDETHITKKGERHATAKKENVCQMCEEGGESLLPCEGQCCGTFHLDCLGLTCKPQGKLLCQECSSGLHSCFSCKQSEGEVRRCMVQQCGRFYHEVCARLSALSVFESKGFRCPLHTCVSCYYNTRSKLKATKGKMMRCTRCPVAYHTGDLCVAAGSEMLTSSAIVCTNHFTAKKGYSHHTHVNVSWCFVCSKGGNLLCCESCPAAFHPDCLNIAMPDGSWYCNDCKAGKKPKYRDIIWVKLGNYRWWPAEIRHPRSIPSNIQHLRHEIGEFPVFFFGSKDYFWTHQARVFPYMEGDRGSKYQKTGIGKVFKKALLEVETRFREIKQEREAKEAQENDRKPPPYKYIKINKPCGRVQIYTADISEIPKCNCKPTDEKPCGFESECLNRMLMYECHPQVCPAGERCQNQGFTKRHYPDTKIIKTAGKGWGLLALRDIKKGEFVNEYVGELIDEVECRARIKYAQENDITHFYMLTINKDRIIDAGPKGNYSRFMNHSCQPNCETQKWTVNGDTRVGLFAVCDIPAGTELTFNYNLDCLGNEKTVCRCGAPNCSGFLGDRPKNSSQTSEVKGKKMKKKQKKRRARNEGRKPSEDECFRCGDGGQLVLCDKKSCTKAYHLSCLDRTKRPFGRWDCPWHHCDVCGKNSEAFCQLCPNSFCKAHQEGALRIWAPTGQWCCQEHEDMELCPILDRREAEVPFIDGLRVPKNYK
ncbi:hypothetical protein AAFF_G00135340 [Aldrovandia affinis]|uniref:[histone H3]-lysine(36) N-dimethyltransferase n=1 Tax=Aldrovandia affinis TaxID=143900 RepID=A0AAD7W9C0_9TELE|nr:hypothetical protein AAFF_G00135340 [Aldrovandia affinis]